eukprot:6742541-Alexandrium_andersonii.AAC.1
MLPRLPHVPTPFFHSARASHAYHKRPMLHSLFTLPLLRMLHTRASRIAQAPDTSHLPEALLLRGGW